ncbi:MAG: hypothetical protein ACI9AB_000308 [Urechidicola sp.]|jgi:hypothetical protein
MLLDKINAYFTKKSKEEETGPAPEGMCPNCWGYTEWDGNYYTEIKDRHILPNTSEFNSFVKNIADKVDSEVHRHGTKYVCESCKTEF